jgi:ubiquinone/menaquinone biosynthesis C-methylase UbiE
MNEDGKALTKTRSSGTGWDHSSHQNFLDYYSKESQSPETLQRFGSVLDIVLRIAEREGLGTGPFEVADIGCGAGTQCLMWASRGHHVHGLDVNQPLLNLAQQRAVQAGLQVDFRVGSAVNTPWSDASMDICLAPELLEHVADWTSCLSEFCRILRPGGILYVSTTNRLCPRQQEFNLPLYSWYPSKLKRHYEQLAIASKPELANFAKYPAVNWFSFYLLRNRLASLGFRSWDRFDLIEVSKKSVAAATLIHLVRNISVARWMGHVFTPYTMVVAVKGRARPAPAQE